MADRVYVYRPELAQKRTGNPYCSQSGRTVLFPKDLLSALRPHAERRDMRPNDLARMIVETVLEEGILDAVLDDLLEVGNA